MQVHLVLWALLTALTGDGYISALSKEVTRIPKIRHKSFSFNNDEDDHSESDAVEENKDIEKEIRIPQLPKAQPSRSKGKPKSILEKLVREPELGKNCQAQVQVHVRSQVRFRKSKDKGPKTWT